MRRLVNPRGRAGFSLVEVLVAVAIAALAFLVLAELQGQLARGQRAAERAERRDSLDRAALALAEGLNPTEACEGEVEVDSEMRMTWTCRELLAPRLVTGFPVGDGAFEVALYEVTVSLRDPDDVETSRLVIERLGWRRIRPITDPALGEF